MNTGHEIISSVTTIVVAIISLATLAVILSKGSATTSVIQAIGSFLSTSINAATRPVAGGGLVAPSLNFPSTIPFGGVG